MRFPRNKTIVRKWWKDKKLVAELDARCDALESGADKGVTLQELHATISKLRQQKYSK